MQRIFLPACLLIALGCSPSATPQPKADAPPAQPAHDGDALTADEKVVKAFILDNADDPKSVEFARWGPNVSGEQLRALIKQLQDNREAAERAKWEEGKKLYDADPAKWWEEKAKWEAAVAKVDGLSPEPRPYPDFVAPSRAVVPPVFSDAGEIDMLVRVRFRGNNRIGAKVLADAVFSVKKHNKVTLWTVNSGDDWWEAQKTLWASMSAR